MSGGNYFRTALLLGLLTGLILVMGHFLGGRTGVVVALGFATLMNLGSYWFSDKIVLAMYRAKPVSEQQAPQLQLDPGFGVHHCTFTRTSSWPDGSSTCTPQAMHGSKEWMVRRISIGCSGSAIGVPSRAAS